MTNEPKAMRDIHEIRLKNYEAEKKLSTDELDNKRKDDIMRTEKIIKDYGLKVIEIKVFGWYDPQRLA